MRVLQHLTDATWPCTVAEISAATGIPSGEVHAVLGELRQVGFVAFDAEVGTWEPGDAALGLGRQARRRDALRAAAMPVAERVARVTGETVTLSARQGYERCYVGQVESRLPTHIAVRLGERVPLVVGANGLAILAALPDADVEHVLRLPRSRVTATTVTDEETIRTRVAAVREQGWARSGGERVRHSTSIAAAILDAAQRPVGSLSVAYLASRVDEDDVPDLADLVVAAAREASRALVQTSA